jgi:tetratricopeptide (TPR) repeat protein
LHGLSGAYQQAWDCFDKAYDAFRALGDIKGQTSALGGVGSAARLLGRYQQAAEHLERALAMAERLDQAEPKVVVLCNLGMLNARLQRHDLALDQLRAAMALSFELGDSPWRATCAVALGERLYRVGAIRQANEALSTGLDVARRIGYVPMQALALTHLGAVAERSGDLDAAIAQHLSALEIVSADAVETIIEIRNNLGEAYLTANRPADARSQFRAVVELTDAAPRPARARALAGLSRCERPCRAADY